MIARYGGTVEKFIGDAVMAVWGARPPARTTRSGAVRAALDLVDAVRVLGPGIQARAGVLTGEAAVTLGATNQGMVAGDLVNTAARLQSVAPAGHRAGRRGHDARGERRDRVRGGRRAGAQGQGGAGPRVAGAARRRPARRAAAARTCRSRRSWAATRSCACSRTCISTTGRDRRARLVSITGPGGIGKSRLAWELEKYIDGISEADLLAPRPVPAYGEGITFWALGEMVRRRAGLAETRRRGHDPRADHARPWPSTSPTDDDRRWVEPALLTLLGLEPAPAGGRDVLFAAWRIFFERIAERAHDGPALRGPPVGRQRPARLHRAPPGVVEERPAHRRDAGPSGAVRPPAGLGQARRATSPASRSSRSATTRCASLLDGFVPGLPEPAIRAILARADGMPLYAVETVRTLVADGRLVRDGDAYRPIGELGELTIPDTLRSLIASRLDALDPVDRSLVADASVLGQTFSVAGLAAVSGQPADVLEPRLKALVRRELFDVEIDPRSPERGQYRFVQSLIREVAYGTLARRERRDPPPGGRALLRGARRRRAGRRARHRTTWPRTRHRRKARRPTRSRSRHAWPCRGPPSGPPRWAPTSRPSPTCARPSRSPPIRASAPRCCSGRQRRRMLQPSTVTPRRSSGRGSTLPAPRAMRVASAPGRPSSARSSSTRVSRRRPSRFSKLLSRRSRRWAAGRSGPRSWRISRGRSCEPTRPRKSIAAADLALDLAEHLGLDRIVAETFTNKGSALSFLGRRRESVALIQAAVDLAHAGGFVAAEIRAMNNLAASFEDVPEARDQYRAAGELARRVGNRNMARWTMASARFASYVLADDWDAALAEAAADVADDQGAHWTRSARSRSRRSCT